MTLRIKSKKFTKGIRKGISFLKKGERGLLDAFQIECVRK